MINGYLSNTHDLDDRAVHVLFSANRWEAIFSNKALPSLLTVTPSSAWPSRRQSAFRRPARHLLLRRESVGLLADLYFFLLFVCLFGPSRLLRFSNFKPFFFVFSSFFSFAGFGCRMVQGSGPQPADAGPCVWTPCQGEGSVTSGTRRLHSKRPSERFSTIFERTSGTCVLSHV
ncbi:MAG: hypothetical protein BJ554DRAFT_7841 [Olpidium bornovanus]|uniref:Transmembrane protein n=1 Tax=Olpidium bornovanus TaxID=278681 RepID=A0A8H8A1Q1_9FUNG|nr:MAG: hypothetical protein BJ554DRAFT_7841 [Olpidium bornovanus]